MILDIKTLVIVYLIINVISAGAVAVIWSQNRGRYAGITLWLVYMGLQATGSLLIVLRGLIPDFISIAIANTMIVAGLVILLIGLERFVGKKGWQIPNYILLAVYCAYSYYNSLHPNLAERNIVLSVIVSIITFQCCWIILRRVDHVMRRITILTGIVLACYVVFNLGRIILTIITPEQTNDFFKSETVSSLAVTVAISLSICLTISLIIMINRRLLMKVKAQEEKFTTAFRSSPYAIMLTRKSDDKVFEVNNGFVNITGYQTAEVIGKTMLDLYLWVRDEDRLHVVNELSMGNDIHEMEIQFRKKTGELNVGLYSANQIMINEEKCILASISDITKHKLMEQQLLQIATHDALTNLPNRMLLYDRFNIALANAQRNKNQLAIVSVDIDYLKTINDTFGHDMGDMLLIATSDRLTRALRKSDTVARMGGDEFILLLTEVNEKADAVKVAEKIIEDFRQPFLLNTHSLNVTISMGIAIFPDNGKDIEELLKSADQSLYRAKESGRDRIVI
jgi:diguanylate cyclase (GGDEF)-like protein/PAS domain S-box-containing protein